MGAFIARQPNGLLCRFSTVVDCITHYNMTDKEYIELCAEKAREDARYNLQRKNFIRPYEEVLECFTPNNMTREEFDAIRNEMSSPVKSNLDQQEQPEVDSLIRSELPDMEDNKSLGLCYCNQFGNNRITSKDVREIARHFYELGLNARNEK